MKPFNEHNAILGKKINIGDYCLHGDVILFKESNLPKDFDKMDKSEDGALAYGEATGHIHQLQGSDFDLRICPNTKERYLKVVKPTMLKHQEHSPVEIDPGLYRIGIQREYSPFDKLIRRVVD